MNQQSTKAWYKDPKNNCDRCQHVRKCPLAFYQYSFCPKIKKLKTGNDSNHLFLSSNHIEALQLIHIN